MIASVGASAAIAQVPSAGPPPKDAGAEGAVSGLGDAGRFTPTPVVSSPTGSPAEKQKWLKDQIDAALNDPTLSAAKVGVSVTEVDSGKSVYGRNDVQLFNPASDS